ncbi:uncharacterized protein [Diadema antillarum]|uniref:uncharacterized protein n=1 Tax=Diadema antillarum TaxID=105358 RepID=UPI003A87E9FE
MEKSTTPVKADTTAVSSGPGGDATLSDKTSDANGEREDGEGWTEGSEGGITKGEPEDIAGSGDGAEGNPPTGKEKEETGDETKDDKEGALQSLLNSNLNALSRLERSKLYEEGVKLKIEGQTEGALKCLLGAITGLSESNTFHSLPQCLHSIADIYFDKKEYEKAVYFIQAEKMYYETALIDIVNVQKPAEKDDEEVNEDGEGESKGSDEEPVEEPSKDDLSPDAKKGQEFENLARLCLKEGKLQLALEYCGKATKMYQAELGEDHPVTVAALDLFTVIYADVGKKLYSDAMEKFEKEEEALKAERSDDSGLGDGQRVMELRHRRNGGEDTPSQEQATHQGELEPTPAEERDDWVMTCLLMLIFFLVTVFIAILVSTVYCYNNSRSNYCAQTRGDINYWYMYLRHVIHDFRKSFSPSR